MTTHLLPVADSLEQAREVVHRRLEHQPRTVDVWDIRQGDDGFYVTPSGDPGYEACGQLVERCYQACPNDNPWAGALR